MSIRPTPHRHLDANRALARRTGWFFHGSDGKRYDFDHFSRDLQNANDAVGLAWRCLDYRHSFGSHLAQEGESLYKIATLMENSPEIYRRHYAALCLESVYDIVEFGPDLPAAARVDALR